MTCWLGGGRATGGMPACGSGSAGRCCSTGWAGSTASTGAAARWTAPACRRKGGDATGPNPTDLGKPGSKRHVPVDGRGIPPAFTLTGANVHDGGAFEEVVDGVPPVRQPGRGRPRERPAKLHGDEAYDRPRCRRALRRRKIGDRSARRGVDSGTRLGRCRRVVERTLAHAGPVLTPARCRRIVPPGVV